MHFRNAALDRIKQFVSKPYLEKYRKLRNLVIRATWYLIPWMLWPIRVSFGMWWLIDSEDCLDRDILEGIFPDRNIHRFMERYIKPGMVVLDIGAHHGYFSLLMSRIVEGKGAVIAFEPSPREIKLLRRNARFNRCRNIRIEATALGNDIGSTVFYEVIGKGTGCNSMRPPNIGTEQCNLIRVPITTLDNWLHNNPVARIDFIKIDAEGAELDILYGAQNLLRSADRPLIICEVQDIRTLPWQYKARNIIEYLHRHGYHWFKVFHDGMIEPMSVSEDDYNDNYLAVPNEKREEVSFLISTVWNKASLK